MLDKTAASATLHCLTGCAIGEIAGLIIGEIFGLGQIITILLAVGLAFLFGYTLSLIPLIQAGITLGVAMTTVLAADTLSIAIMEITDNAVMAAVPGAMESGIVNPLFWLTLSLALMAAFFAAYPVNKHLLKKGKGHALLHEHHGDHNGH